MSIYLNDYDLRRIRDGLNDNPTPTENLEAVLNAVCDFKFWVDDNSDGWAYWEKGRRAANTACTLLKAAHDQLFAGPKIDDVTAQQAKIAVANIKRFLTRRGVDHTTVLGA